MMVDIPFTMPKSMGEILLISDETKISPGHLINFSADDTTACCVGGNILSFANMVPNAVVFRWDYRVTERKGLSDRQEST